MGLGSKFAVALVFIILMAGCAGAGRSASDRQTFHFAATPGNSDQQRGLLQPIGVEPTWTRLHFWAALSSFPDFLDNEANLLVMADQMSVGAYRRSADQFGFHNEIAKARANVPQDYAALLRSPLRITAYVGQSPRYDFERHEWQIFDASARNILDVINQSDVCLSSLEQRQTGYATGCLQVPNSFHAAPNSAGKAPDLITEGRIELSPPIEFPRTLPMERETAEQALGQKHRCQSPIIALIDIQLVSSAKITVRNPRESVATIVARPTDVKLACETVTQGRRSYVRLY